MSGPLTGSSNGMNTPRDFVLSGWDKFSGWSDRVLGQALDAAQALGNIEIRPIAFDVDFGAGAEFGSFMHPGSPPEVPPFGGINVTIPPAPTVGAPTLRSAGPVPPPPDYSGLTYTPVPRPNITAPPAPVLDDPDLLPITIPDAPTDGELAVTTPTLLDLNLPSAPPTITIPTFAGQRPTFDIDAPGAPLQYTELAYVPRLVDDIQTKLADMLEGGLGLSAAIEQGIFDRGRDRQDQVSAQVNSELDAEFAARGLGGEPNGVIAMRRAEERQRNRTAKSELNREITIEMAKMRVDSVKFAVAEGIAYEQMLIAQNNAINDRRLTAARAVVDVAIALFNVQVQRFQAELAAFQTDAQVHRVLVDAALAEIEVYKARIEAERVKNDVNTALIAQYEAEIRARNLLVERYNGQIQAAKTIADTNIAKLEAQRVEIQKYASEVDAYGKRYDAYRSEVEGQLGTVKWYQALADMYGSRMRGYSSLTEALVSEGRMAVDAGRLEVDAYRASIDGVRANIEAQVAGIRATSDNYNARSQAYIAEGQMAIAESAAFDRTAQLRIEEARSRAEIELKEADILINQANQNGALLVEQLKGKAQVLSQLAGSVLSGVNFGANYNGTLGFSYQKSFTYSGETPDSTPTY